MIDPKELQAFLKEKNASLKEKVAKKQRAVAYHQVLQSEGVAHIELQGVDTNG